MPSGSRNICCRFFSGNFTILSSIEGQYLGPTPWITPEYIGDLSRLARIISAVASVVKVIWHGSWPLTRARIEPGGYVETCSVLRVPFPRDCKAVWFRDCSTWNISGVLGLDCSTWNISGVLGLDCSTWNNSSFQKLKYGTGSSPCWTSVLVRSIERRNNLGGVPVFRRPSSIPISL